MSREEFLLYTNGLWNFSGESKKRLKHPAPFPRELPRRCIQLFSFLEDTIFDPFSGFWHDYFRGERFRAF